MGAAPGDLEMDDGAVGFMPGEGAEVGGAGGERAGGLTTGAAAVGVETGATAGGVIGAEEGGGSRGAGTGGFTGATAGGFAGATAGGLKGAAAGPWAEAATASDTKAKATKAKREAISTTERSRSGTRIERWEWCASVRCAGGYLKRDEASSVKKLN